MLTYGSHTDFAYGLKKVRIHKYKGKLDAVEGVLVTVAGKRKRQLSLTIGDMTTLVTDLNSDIIEIIE